MAKFCSSCGARLSAENTACPSCGKTEEAGERQPIEFTGVSNAVAAALCYFWFAAIVFLLIAPYNRNREIRFHAYQGLFLAAIWLAGQVVLQVIPILGWMILPIWSVLMLALCIACAIKAYQGERLILPVISETADKQSIGKSTV